MVIVSTKEQGKNVWNSIENLDGSVLSQFAFHFFSGSVQLGWKRGQDEKIKLNKFGTSVKQQLTHSSFIIRDFPLAGRQKAPFIGIFLKQVYIRHWHYPKNYTTICLTLRTSEVFPTIMSYDRSYHAPHRRHQVWESLLYQVLSPQTSWAALLPCQHAQLRHPDKIVNIGQNCWQL